MPATIFYSENGELSLPEEPRNDGKKYKPVAPGEPLCVEIGVNIYNLINQNDVLLKADLDLSFTPGSDPSTEFLLTGRKRR